MSEYGQVFENVNLKDYTTLKVGGTAKYLVKVFDEESLSNLIAYLKNKNIKYYILGNGSNVILDDSYFDGVIIKLDNLNKIAKDGNLITAGAGVMLPVLVKACFDFGFSDLAFLGMIPGNVGGSVVGNAGCYGDEIMNYVKTVIALDKDGKIKVFDKNDISFGYRFTSLKDKYIILAVIFVLSNTLVTEGKNNMKIWNEKRIAMQPLDRPNCGSVFRNPENASAGKLIDEAGLKGYQIGGARVSDKHANFIVNENGATFEDVITLINLIKDKIKKNNKLDLVLEPTIVKWEEL